MNSYMVPGKFWDTLMVLCVPVIVKLNLVVNVVTKHTFSNLVCKQLVLIKVRVYRLYKSRGSCCTASVASNMTRHITTFYWMKQEQRNVQMFRSVAKYR
jgi:hypothetical protein